MKKLTDLEYLKLNKFEAFVYNFKSFLFAIPGWILSLCVAVINAVKNFAVAIKDQSVDIVTTFT